MPDLDRSTQERVQAPRVDLDEPALVRRAQLGSTAAFDQLVVRRGPDLYRYLLVRLRDESDAKDTLQETMTAAWQGLPALRDAERFWPWLVAIARRNASASARRRVSTSQLDPDSLGVDDQVGLEIWDAIGRLSARHRDVLVLRYRLELSEEETAEALDIRIGTVKSRCARARKLLLEALR
jgi:RNA polymerase sigma-70 factor (ECF subfamily)